MLHDDPNMPEQDEVLHHPIAVAAAAYLGPCAFIWLMRVFFG